MNCLIFDDHPLVGFAIKSIVAKMDLVDEAISVMTVKEALRAVKNKNIDLLILDVNFPDCDGFDFFRRIKSRGYNGKTIFFSGETSHIFSDLAGRLGANGYVCKTESFDILKDAIEAVIKGYSFFKFEEAYRDNQVPLPDLSTRENAVIKYLIQGKRNREIASILSISDKTVSTYKRRVLDKYNANNIQELIRLMKGNQ